MDMQELRKLRTSNFALIVKTKGLSQIVEITGRQKSQISDCAAGRRTIGERLARKLEAELCLEPGSLDLPIKGEGLSISQVGQYRVPLRTWSDIASGLDSEPIDVLLTSMKPIGNLLALEIKDPSMSPVFNIGERIIIDTGLTPAPGDYVVAVSDGEAVFRKFRLEAKDKFQLVPLNNDFPVIENSSTTIIGVMVEHRIYRRR